MSNSCGEAVSGAQSEARKGISTSAAIRADRLLTDIACRHVFCTQGKVDAWLADSGGLYLEIVPAEALGVGFGFTHTLEGMGDLPRAACLAGIGGFQSTRTPEGMRDRHRAGARRSQGGGKALVVGGRGTGRA